MPRYAEIHFDENTRVRLELAPVRDPAQDHDAAASVPPHAEGVLGSKIATRAGEVVATLEQDALEHVLRPLGPLLRTVHDAVAAGDDPPQQIAVQFGLQIGEDLALGVVGASGQATITVSATWLPARRDAPGP
ncbi:CU044_2847 family protein [Streptomyces sp. ICBB 8177]|uniref:CU044_2847 family protein n=1 Tax=Streptomyces sp. ICBB 8177 TaxID=563922 RepID=UPI000D67CD14|nr:CU044_2847 family protein [Streptomyces sp. ICBB 8177]PWI42257.1 hypothetical protein CK485_21655 [Streptomyces sp. ICBB 8177]